MDVPALRSEEEGRGEGATSRRRAFGAGFDHFPREHPPLTSIRSPEGRGGEGVRCAHIFYSMTTGILPIFVRHSFGPVWCTEVPALSTATVTGMSFTSNS